MSLQMVCQSWQSEGFFSKQSPNRTEGSFSFFTANPNELYDCVVLEIRELLSVSVAPKVSDEVTNGLRL